MKENYGKLYSGWVFARELIDDDGKMKLFAFYPREEHGVPPYLYKTKTQAVAALRRGLMRHSDAKLVKYQPRMYLDRY